MKKVFLCLIAMLTLEGAVAVAGEWTLRTDANQTVAVSEIDYLLASDNDRDFSIVLKSGNIVAGVKKATVSDSEAGVETLDGQKPVVRVFPNPVAERLLVSGCKAGSSLEILSVDGRLVKSIETSEGETSIDVEGLTKGYYLLRTENSSVKFLKK